MMSSEPNYIVDGIDLEPAVEAADRIIGTSPRKAIYEMSWDLADAAVRAAFPEIRKALADHTSDTERS